MSIQYPVPGFETKTFKTRFSSRNHWTLAPTDGMTLFKETISVTEITFSSLL